MSERIDNLGLAEAAVATDEPSAMEAVPLDAVHTEDDAPECPPPLFWRDVLSEVRRASVEWAVEREGAVITGRTLGRGRALYLLKPCLGNWETFALLMWLLRDEFRLVVLDGLTPTPGTKRIPPSRLTVDEAAADLVAVADALNDRRLSLFATSSATLTAWSAMLAVPQRIERAVMFASMSRVQLSRPERALLFLGRFVNRGFSRLPFFDRVQTHNHRRWFPPFDETRWRFLLENLGETPVSQWSRQMSVHRKTDFRANLPEIDVPVLLLRGEGEGRTGEQRVEELSMELPRAESELLPHCGRFAYLTHPHILAKRIRTFFGVRG